MNDLLLPGHAEIEQAAKLVYAAMPATPQYSWPLLNAALGTETWVKHENHTPTGAFKVRGGLVYLQEPRACRDAGAARCLAYDPLLSPRSGLRRGDLLDGVAARAA